VPPGPLGFIARFCQGQGSRRPLRGRWGGYLRPRLQGGVAPSGVARLPHGRFDGTIPPPPPKRQARGGAALHPASSADIPGAPAGGAPRGDRERTTTPAPPQQATAQGRPPSRGATGPFLWPVALGLQELLGGQTVLPTAVPGVMVEQQTTPRRQRLLPTLALRRPPVDEHDLGCRTALDQRSSLGRIPQPLSDTRPPGHAPEDSAPQGPRADLRPRPRRLTIPEQRLTGTAPCTQCLEDASNSVVPLAVRARCDPIVTRADEPNGPCPHAMAPLHFGCTGVPGSLTQEAQCICGPGALHPEPQPLLALARRREASSSEEHRLRQRTPIEQMRPVAIVAGQP